MEKCVTAKEELENDLYAKVYFGLLLIHLKKEERKKKERFRFPTRTGKPGKMERHLPIREKSGHFEQIGKVGKNHTKYWKIQGMSEKCYLLFLVIFK